MVIYSGFSHKKWWFSIVMLVYQRVSPRWLIIVSSMSSRRRWAPGPASQPLQGLSSARSLDTLWSFPLRSIRHGDSCGFVWKPDGTPESPKNPKISSSRFSRLPQYSMSSTDPVISDSTVLCHQRLQGLRSGHRALGCTWGMAILGGEMRC